jgi:sugar lactone lactonase YvrE
MAPRADGSADAGESRDANGHAWLGIGVGVVGLIAAVALVWFTVPATVALIDRVVPLSDPNVVRIYMMWPLVLTGFILVGLLATTRRDQPRRAVLVACLLAANVILLGVLMGDRRDFTSEGNSITWFTSIVLLCTSAAAAMNFVLSNDLQKRRRFWRAVWGLAALGFAFLALDEALALHELAGSLADRLLDRPEAAAAVSGGPAPGGVVQDYITIVYASGAVVAAGIMVAIHRSGWIERGRIFHLVAMLGVACYAVAVSLDNVDKLQSLTGSIDLIYLANAVEEVLEFTAACLFLASALIAVIELRRARVPAERDRRSLPIVGSRPGRVVVLGAAVAIGLLALVVPVLARPAQSLIAETDAYDVVQLAGVDGAPLNPDGMRWESGRLFVTDDVEGSVLVREGSVFRRLAGKEDGFTRPETVAVAADGSILVSDDITNELRVIREGQPSELVAGPTDGLLGPRGLIVGADGALYISDRLGVAVVRYADGNLETFAGPLDGITEPEELTVDDEGRIYVAEEGAGRVLRIGASGEAEVFLDEASGIGSPEGITVADGSLYVADAINGAIHRFDVSTGEGEEIATFAPRFRRVEGLAVGDAGEIYVGIRRDAPLSGLVLQLTPKTGQGG